MTLNTMDRKIVFASIGTFVILIGLTTTFSILYFINSNNLVSQLAEVPSDEIVDYYETRTALISTFEILAAVFGSLTGICLVFGAWFIYRKK